MDKKTKGNKFNTKASFLPQDLHGWLKRSTFLWHQRHVWGRRILEYVLMPMTFQKLCWNWLQQSSRMLLHWFPSDHSINMESINSYTVQHIEISNGKFYYVQILVTGTKVECPQISYETSIPSVWPLIHWYVRTIKYTLEYNQMQSQSKTL